MNTLAHKICRLLLCSHGKIIHLLANVGDLSNRIDGANSAKVRQVIMDVDHLLKRAPELRAVFRKFVPRYIRERLTVV